jgi:hypothetical protein
MRSCGLTFLILSSLVCAPNSTSAQTSADETRQAELQDWVRAYKEWKAWADEWLGKRQPGWFGARDRKEKPDPPAWLSDYCRDSSLVQASFAEGCRLLADWRDDLATALIREQMQKQRTRGEATERTRWWNHIHFDALWLTTQVPVTYGVIGIHATHKIAGRFQIFLAPGAILLNIPTPNGREWKPATDLGVTYQLLDFKFPGRLEPASLHINIAKAWVVGNEGSFIDSSVELAGLSVSFK